MVDTQFALTLVLTVWIPDETREDERTQLEETVLTKIQARALTHTQVGICAQKLKCTPTQIFRSEWTYNHVLRGSQGWSLGGHSVSGLLTSLLIYLR